MRGSGTSHSPLALYSIHTSQIAARTPSPACWGRACPLARPGGGAIGRRKTPVVRRAVGAGWGVARCFRTDGNAAARPSPPYITIEARSLPQLRWGRWRGAPDGVRPAAATQVGLQNRQCELASSRPCPPHPIRPPAVNPEGLDPGGSNPWGRRAALFRPWIAASPYRAPRDDAWVSPSSQPARLPSPRRRAGRSAADSPPRLADKRRPRRAWMRAPRPEARHSSRALQAPTVH